MTFSCCNLRTVCRTLNLTLPTKRSPTGLHSGQMITASRRLQSVILSKDSLSFPSRYESLPHLVTMRSRDVILRSREGEEGEQTMTDEAKAGLGGVSVTPPALLTPISAPPTPISTPSTTTLVNAIVQEVTKAASEVTPSFINPVTCQPQLTFVGA